MIRIFGTTLTRGDIAKILLAGTVCIAFPLAALAGNELGRVFVGAAFGLPRSPARTCCRSCWSPAA